VQNDNIVKLIQPGAVSDPLTEILRNGAQALLVQVRIQVRLLTFLIEGNAL
jgi:hypothetical protein